MSGRESPASVRGFSVVSRILPCEDRGGNAPVLVLRRAVRVGRCHDLGSERGAPSFVSYLSLFLLSSAVDRSLAVKYGESLSDNELAG